MDKTQECFNVRPGHLPTYQLRHMLSMIPWWDTACASLQRQNASGMWSTQATELRIRLKISFLVPGLPASLQSWTTLSNREQLRLFARTGEAAASLW